MKKIVFFGDSVTEMCRQRDCDGSVFSYGNGFVYLVAAKMHSLYPNRYEIINRGVGGNRIVDLYARIKGDVWSQKPDVVNFLIGINDVWHRRLPENNCSDLPRFEKIYRMMIEETLEQFPKAKLMIGEPFVLHDETLDDIWDEIRKVRDYAKLSQKIAEDYRLPFMPLQEKLEEAAKKYGSRNYLYDGVHPAVAGASLIAEEWLKLYFDMVEDKQ